jgi:hypothetical protein
VRQLLGGCSFVVLTSRCDVIGPREAKKEQSLVLDELTDIYIGKQTRIFKQQSTTRVSNDVCFSLITPRQSLDIEGTPLMRCTPFLPI